MSEWMTFVRLGFSHITDVGAMDHILFLLALAAIYRLREWRTAVWVITAFTVGHSVTLALAVSGSVMPPAPLIEFLIPVTIVITAVENLLVRDRSAGWRVRYRPVFAGVFGLVHGAGFANYLRSMFVDEIAVPLFGFNVGIELGQIFVLAIAFLALEGADRGLARLRLPARAPSPLRLRILAVSSVVALIAGRWALERAPW